MPIRVTATKGARNVSCPPPIGRNWHQYVGAKKAPKTSATKAQLTGKGTLLTKVDVSRFKEKIRNFNRVNCNFAAAAAASNIMAGHQPEVRDGALEEVHAGIYAAVHVGVPGGVHVEVRDEVPVVADAQNPEPDASAHQLPVVNVRGAVTAPEPLPHATPSLHDGQRPRKVVRLSGQISRVDAARNAAAKARRTNTSNSTVEQPRLVNRPGWRPAYARPYTPEQPPMKGVIVYGGGAPSRPPIRRRHPAQAQVEPTINDNAPRSQAVIDLTFSDDEDEPMFVPQTDEPLDTLVPDVRNESVPVTDPVPSVKLPIFGVGNQPETAIQPSSSADKPMPDVDDSQVSGMHEGPSPHDTVSPVPALQLAGSQSTPPAATVTQQKACIQRHGCRCKPPGSYAVQLAIERSSAPGSTVQYICTRKRPHDCGCQPAVQPKDIPRTRAAKSLLRVNGLSGGRQPVSGQAEHGQAVAALPDATDDSVPSTVSPLEATQTSTNATKDKGKGKATEDSTTTGRDKGKGKATEDSTTTGRDKGKGKATEDSTTTGRDKGKGKATKDSTTTGKDKGKRKATEEHVSEPVAGPSNAGSRGVKRTASGSEIHRNISQLEREFEQAKAKLEQARLEKSVRDQAESGPSRRRRESISSEEASSGQSSDEALPTGRLIFGTKTSETWDQATRAPGIFSLPCVYYKRNPLRPNVTRPLARLTKNPHNYRCDICLLIKDVPYGSSCYNQKMPEGQKICHNCHGRIYELIKKQCGNVNICDGGLDVRGGLQELFDDLCEKEKRKLAAAVARG